MQIFIKCYIKLSRSLRGKFKVCRAITLLVFSIFFLFSRFSWHFFSFSVCVSAEPAAAAYEQVTEINKTLRQRTLFVRREYGRTEEKN